MLELYILQYWIIRSQYCNLVSQCWFLHSVYYNIGIIHSTILDNKIMILVLGIPILVFAFPIYYNVDIGTSYMYWISSQHWIVILQYWLLHFQYTSILVLHILQYWIMRSWYWYWAFHCWLLHSHFITISVLQIR